MRSGGNNFNYFPENQLTKLAHFVQFQHVLMTCLGIGGWSLCLPWLRQCLNQFF